MAYFAMECHLVDDYLTRRGPYREAHLALLRHAADDGTLLLAGALDSPANRSLLIWRDEAAAREFAEADPYYAAGIVRRLTIQEWAVAAGAAYQD